MPTSWVTVAWSAAFAACLTLALPNLIVWARDRKARAHLLFATASVATALVAVAELLLMRETSPEHFGIVLRWAHLAFLALFVSLVGFVRLYLDAGRPWLAWAAIGTRAFATLVLNFLSPVNLNYTAIPRLLAIPFLGEKVSVADGVENPWVRVGELSNVLFLAFLVEAAVTVWRRGDRRRAVMVCGGMILFISVTATHVALIHAGLIRSPYIVSFSYLGILLAMAYELGSDVLSARDLARRLQASEVELRESEERMSLAAKAASIAHWVWDVAADDIWMTEAGRALRGFGRSEPITFARVLDSVHPDDRDGLRRAVEEALGGGSDLFHEYRLVQLDGQERWNSVRGAIERDVAGTPVRLRGVSIDITPRKLAEQELLQQREELAHLSRVTMMGELSGSLAHELNQPLTAILSNAQAAQRLLARESPDVEEVREILKDIVDQDRRAGDVIQRLRVLLKKGTVRQQPLDVSEILQDVLKIVRSDLVNRGVVVRTELGPDLPTVKGDRVQFQQVLLNLVMNGSDAMSELAADERRLEVRTERNEDGGVHVSVADQGCGIPEDGLARVFEPFFSTKPLGLGLGLTVCRTIIDSFGGRIWATNNADSRAGATFHVLLPPVPGRE
jgi:two-component system, LuxR family, sensor kinase FixL